MAIRICPHCGKTVPAALIAALSDDLECPHCQTRLAVSNGSRMFSSTVGLVVAGLVYWLTRNSTNMLGFALPVLFAVLAFGVVSAVVLIFTAALRIATATPVFEPVGTHDYGRTHDHASDLH
jgi:uncharacterized paraquat-inducible protein A